MMLKIETNDTRLMIMKMIMMIMAITVTTMIIMTMRIMAIIMMMIIVGTEYTTLHIDKMIMKLMTIP